VQQFGAFDIVLAPGLLHHPDDNEAQYLFRPGFTALPSGGRMVTNDVCCAPGQSFAERHLLSRDRGRFISTREEYSNMAHGWFSEVIPYLHDNSLRVPHAHLIMECIR
jgi:hypothetical protein